MEREDRPHEAIELVEKQLATGTTCDDCGRHLRAGEPAVTADDVEAPTLCLECVAIDTVHVIGTAGAGARSEHARRRDRREQRVRVEHPRLGALILALSDEPAHIQAWAKGAAGEEAFGQKLSEMASRTLVVLHDRKLPGSRTNIDHLAVTPAAVWVLDAKRYKGRVEARGGGILVKRPPTLFVRGRDQTKLIDGVKRQVAVVEDVLAAFAEERGIERPNVRGALAFMEAEFGWLERQFTIDGVRVSSGKSVRRVLRDEVTEQLPVPDIAKRLAREFAAGG